MAKLLWCQWCFSEGFSWVSEVERLHCMHSLKLPLPQQTATDWIYDNASSWGFGQWTLETGKKTLFPLHSYCWSKACGPGKWKDEHRKKHAWGKTQRIQYGMAKKYFCYYSGSGGTI